MYSQRQRQFCVVDERGQKIRPFPKALELGNDVRAEVVGVGGRKVCEPCELGVAPDSFVRIQLGGVCRQSFSNDPTVVPQELPDDVGSIVHVASVPHDRYWSTQLTDEKADEIDNIVGPDIVVFREQLKVEAQSLSYRTQRHRTDGRDPVSSIPTLVNRGLSTWRERSTNEGSQHEA